MAALRAHVRICGRVQGVCFREATLQQAEVLQITGWVRNLSDGSVEALFEGEESKVREILEYVRQGPPLARVTAVDVREEIGEAAFNSFKVERTRYAS